MRRLLIITLATLGIYAAPVSADTPAEEAVDANLCKGCEALLELALANPRREADRARDRYRNPAETLAFFQVKPGMTVIDYMPATGWYTRILAPYLGSDGHYIGLNPAVPDGAPEGLAAYLGGLGEKFPAAAAAWNLGGVKVEAFNTNELGGDRDATVDRVLIFREMHNLHRNGLLHDELNRLHDLLRPGGMLGIVQHRAKQWAAADYTDGSKGYMRQQDVIGLVEAHGFDLVATSEINANVLDTADHPAGVWELLPMLRTDREDLKAIGESDRMTLLFRKRS